MTEDVAEREKRFHNERFSRETDPRASLDKWYNAVRHGTELQDVLVRRYAKNKTVLEYGCADGGLSLDRLNLPEYCKSLTGIDISDVALRKAQAKAAQSGFDNVQFTLMDAEAMTFSDQTFDLVFGRGIVHHLDLEKSFSEVSRVLHDNGIAIFCEPMGHNPVLNIYRNWTPDIRTADEHPLLMDDFAIARRHFARVDRVFYGLFSVASVFFDRTATGLSYRLLKAIDDVVLRLPVVRRYAWYCLLVCHEPRRGNQSGHTGIASSGGA
jgi:SAM-dependent methyltransferase